METNQGSITGSGNTAIKDSNHRKNESEDFEMIENNQSNSREMEHALKALEQAKARVANERKKLNEKRRKEENHHKYLMGGIIVKYFPECYQFDEAELNKILRVALATNECQQIIKNIKGQNGENANQNTVEQGIVCLATANRETYTFPTVQRTHLPFCVLCVQIKAKKQHLPAHKVFVCHPLLFGKGVCYG